MPSTNWLLRQLAHDYPAYSFEAADEFLWSAHTHTIYYDEAASHSQEYCLHELSHALLGHKSYRYDIDLLKIERDAWEYAQNNLAVTYKIPIEDEIIQENLDTYRSWLHARSKCPNCDTVGLQTKEQKYHCLACRHIWKVNEARLCALRRYAVT